MSSASAARGERSRMRPGVYGPRSLILTTTKRPLLRFVTLAYEANGSERCAAVAVMVSRTSPLAVFLPTRLYQAAFPEREIPVLCNGVQQGSEMRPRESVAGSTRANRRATCSEPLSEDAPSISGPPAKTEN